jgi:hypothetical protein
MKHNNNKQPDLVRESCLMLATAITALIAVYCVSLISWRNEYNHLVNGPKEITGQNHTVDMIIYFHKNVTQDEINYFNHNIIATTNPNNPSEFDLLPELSGTMSTSSEDGHDGIAIWFWPDVTKEERLQIKRILLSYPYVYNVLENVAPSDVIVVPTPSKR